MVITRKKRNQQKKLSHLNETLDDFIIGNATGKSAMENETLEEQTNGQHNYLERFVDSESQNQVIEKSVDDKIRRLVDNVDSTVEICGQDAILTALDKVLLQGLKWP